MASIFRAAARFIVGMLFRLFTRYHVINRNRIRRQGSLIVVANHPSLFDPPLIGTILKREALFMAKDGLFSSAAISRFIRALGAFPIGRNQLSRQSLKQAITTIKEEKVLVMFPEGGRSDQGRMKKASPGAFMLAIKLKTPILPIAINGTQQINSFKDLLKRPCITVTIGEVFYPNATNGKIKEQAAELADVTMERIASLLPPRYHGYYADKGEPIGTKN
jgi:1-acyl-sn-glycerol-3-phosphate acyltransferase